MFRDVSSEGTLPDAGKQWGIKVAVSRGIRSFLFRSLSLHLLNQMIDETKGICQKAKLIERIVHLRNAEMEKGKETPAELCNEYKFYF